VEGRSVSSTGTNLPNFEGVDCVRLRLFFLSLLWRAAATSLFEFNSVSMSANELTQLREMVLHGEVKPYHFYPVTLAQLSTRIFPHNTSRLIKRQPMVDSNTGELVDGALREIDHYRFYFDGTSMMKSSTWLG
jgi:hypothetical protein